MEGIGIIFVYAAIAMAFVMFIWLILVPLKLVKKILVNIVLGFICIFIFNAIAEFGGFSTIAINLLTTVIVGILGVPGFVAIVVINNIL